MNVLKAREGQGEAENNLTSLFKLVAELGFRCIAKRQNLYRKETKDNEQEVVESHNQSHHEWTQPTG